MHKIMFNLQNCIQENGDESSFGITLLIMFTIRHASNSEIETTLQKFGQMSATYYSNS